MRNFLITLFGICVVACLSFMYIDNAKYTLQTNVAISPQKVTYVIKSEDLKFTYSNISIQKRCPSLHYDVDVFYEHQLVARSSNHLIYDGTQQVLYTVKHNRIYDNEANLVFLLNIAKDEINVIDFQTDNISAIIYPSDLRFDNLKDVDPRLLLVLLGYKLFLYERDACNVYFSVFLIYGIVLFTILLSFVCISIYTKRKYA